MNKNTNYFSIAIVLLAITGALWSEDILYLGNYNSMPSQYGRDFKYVRVPDQYSGDQQSHPPVPDWNLDSCDHSAWVDGVWPISWSANGDLFVYKEIYLYRSIPLTLRVAVDNGYDFYINGNFISGHNAGGGASYWEYTVNVDSDYVKPGANMVAFRFEDYGGGTYADIAITGDALGMVPQDIPPAIKPVDDLFIASGIPFSHVIRLEIPLPELVWSISPDNPVFIDQQGQLGWENPVPSIDPYDFIIKAENDFGTDEANCRIFVGLPLEDGVVIEEDDNSLDGQVIIITGGTVVIRGRHSFGALAVRHDEGGNPGVLILQDGQTEASEYNCHL